MAIKEKEKDVNFGFIRDKKKVSKTKKSKHKLFFIENCKRANLALKMNLSYSLAFSFTCLLF